MAEDEKYWWDDKTIQVPKGLLIKGVSGEALAVYAKMKGFGAEVRCSLGALATRLGWSDAKARKYQNELWQAGWITLLVEGQGGGSTGKGYPRQWWMASNAGELPPQELVARVCKNATLPAQAEGHVLEGPLFQGPSKPLPEAYKALEANKESSNELKGKHPEQDQFWQEASARWKAHSGLELSWPKARGFQKDLTKALAKLGAQELARRFGNHLAAFGGQKSLTTFFFDLDKWAVAPTSSKPGGARAFHQAEAPAAFSLGSQRVVQN